MSEFEKERLDYMKFLKKEIVPKKHPLQAWLDEQIEEAIDILGEPLPPKCDECSSYDCDNCPATYEEDSE